MKKIFTSIISLFFLFILSLLLYLAWILNKGEFESQYLEEFLNNRLKKEGFFYSKIENPIIKFDKNTKKLPEGSKNGEKSELTPSVTSYFLFDFIS